MFNLQIPSPSWTENYKPIKCDGDIDTFWPNTIRIKPNLIFENEKAAREYAERNLFKKYKVEINNEN